jgi:hypothetical protein
VYYISDQKAYKVQSTQAAQDWGFGDVSAQTYPQLSGESINDLFTVEKQLPPAP